MWEHPWVACERLLFFFVCEGYFLFGCLLSLSSACAGCFPLDRPCITVWHACSSRNIGAVDKVCSQCLVTRLLEWWGSMQKWAQDPLFGKALDSSSDPQSLCAFPCDWEAKVVGGHAYLRNWRWLQWFVLASIASSRRALPLGRLQVHRERCSYGSPALPLLVLYSSGALLLLWV